MCLKGSKKHWHAARFACDSKRGDLEYLTGTLNRADDWDE